MKRCLVTRYANGIRTFPFSAVTNINPFTHRNGIDKRHSQNIIWLKENIGPIGGRWCSNRAGSYFFKTARARELFRCAAHNYIMTEDFPFSVIIDACDSVSFSVNTVLIWISENIGAINEKWYIKNNMQVLNIENDQIRYGNTLLFVDELDAAIVKLRWE